MSIELILLLKALQNLYTLNPSIIIINILLINLFQIWKLNKFVTSYFKLVLIISIAFGLFGALLFVYPFLFRILLEYFYHTKDFTFKLQYLINKLQKIKCFV
jgi:hypothetical protein